MTAYACDLAISAVASDGAFVTEVSAELSARLRTPAEWHGASADANAEPAPLLSAGHSRVALVLHHHLWLHDTQTVGDAVVLRTRVHGRRGSVCVLALDDSPVAGWLAGAPRYQLRESGRVGVVDFVVGVVEARGGTVKPGMAAVVDAPVGRSFDVPTPFLGQPRAHSALRHEFDDIIARLRQELERERGDLPASSFKLHVLPYRVIAQLDTVAISFSWMAGRHGVVSDGHLLVIAWRDVANAVAGAPALKAAVPFYEREYVADGNAPGEWQWRTEDRARQPYASAQLVADWIARASIARLL